MTKKFSSIAVCGGGAWGTALAALAARNDVDTLLWARNKSVVEDINSSHYNSRYLPDRLLPDGLRASSDPAEAVQQDALLFMVPAQEARGVFQELASLAPQGLPIAIGAKGIERGSLKLMPEVLKEAWPKAEPAMLSGPSFAHDVADGKPTAVTLAATSPDLGEKWQTTIGAPHFRPYVSDDLTGVALGGAVKNVLAIAAGIVDGLQLGQSAHAALIARGFAEFQRLGLAMGALPATMAGLSGLGDLILTAGSNRSRNMSLGQMLGRGQTLEEILQSRHSVSEGVASAAAVTGLANRYDIEMPVCSAVADIVDGKVALAEAMASLMRRPFKREDV